MNDDPRLDVYLRGMNKVEQKICGYLLADRRMEVNRSGWPDFLVTWVDTTGRVHGIGFEVKHGKDKVRDNQRRMHQVLGILGLPVFVVKNYKDVRDAFRKYLRKCANGNLPLGVEYACEGRCPRCRQKWPGVNKGRIGVADIHVFAVGKG